MRLHSLLFRSSLHLFVMILLLSTGVERAAAQALPQNQASAVRTPAVPARITQAIDETQLVRLKGNIHPLARPEFDQGPVSDASPMNRMMLLLQRSPDQETALLQFLDELQSKDSPNFHQWLTPEQFGAKFGPADADLQTVTSWLTSRGFTGIRVSKGRNVIEFSGKVGQVRNAFHTEIHHFVVNGEHRQANTADPQIPAALTPVVAGVATLHNFPSRSMRREVGQFSHTRVAGETTPQFTTSGGNYALGPADFAKIYNIPPALDGTGAKIAIIGFSTISVSDATSFRALFGLPVNDPVVVNNGPDPGVNGEEGEADLDVQWSGAVAPKAEIDYVLTEGTQTADPLTLGAEYVIDNNSDDVMSLSFGNCEANLGATNAALISNMWEQAAAQGITVAVSAGDNGSAGCDDFNTQTTAALGIAVNGLASTAFNIAVGGTDFDDAGTQLNFWSATNSTDGKRESALGYIHEMPWNDSCAATATPTNLTTCATANNIVAGSGGPSILHAKPPWQNGVTPADGHRDLPDVSLFASDGPQSKSFYVICQADAITPGSPPSCASSGPFSFFGVGGTSASAPSFAGIIALIGQSEAAAGRSRRQGNANVVLYAIGQTAANFCNSTTQPLAPPATCVFYDVTKSNNSVPCAGGSLNCSSTTAGTNGVLVTVSGATKTPAFTAGTGYDLATGLGTVNVANLATAWGTTVGTFKGSTTSLKINGGTTPVSITHGTGVTATVTVVPKAPATGTPTGDVAVLGSSGPLQMNAGGNDATLSGGTVTINSVILPGGTYNATAHYAGDGTFASSDDPTGVAVTVAKENSRLQYGIVTFNPANGAITSTNATSFTYGSPYILRFDILNSTANACTPLAATPVVTGCALDATGAVTITDNGSPLDGGTFPVNSEGNGEDQPIQLTGGNHMLSATYSGDNSYNAVVTPVIDAVVVSKATTATAIVPSVSTVASGTPMTITATMTSQSNSSVGTTGIMTFFDGGTQIGSAVAVTPTPASALAFAGGTAVLTNTFTTTGMHSITATYSGDTNYSTSSATAITVTVTSSGTFAVSYNPNTVVLSSTTGASATTTVTVTPSGGFTGMVTIVCPTANLPPGVTCTPPAAINVTSGPATGTLTLAVTATSTTLSASAKLADRPIYAAGFILPSAGNGWWMFSAGAGLAATILLLLPGRKRYRTAMTLGVVCVLGFTLGCNNYNNTNGGPVATVTKITVPAPGRVASGGTFTFAATVTGGTPAGQIQLFDNGVAIGTAASVSGGAANLTTPATLAVGTHAISAHYAGDTYTMASQSGTINVTVTGNATVAITTNPAATPAASPVNLTIN